MKSKTSVTLPSAVLQELDRVLGENGNRSEFVGQAVRERLERLAREERDRRDLKLLNDHAKYLNREAADVLTYQVEP